MHIANLRKPKMLAAILIGRSMYRESRAAFDWGAQTYPGTPCQPVSREAPPLVIPRRREYDFAPKKNAGVSSADSNFHQLDARFSAMPSFSHSTLTLLATKSRICLNG